MTTPTDTTSPAEMFLAAAERVTATFDFLARDWHRLNDKIPAVSSRPENVEFRLGQMREAEKAIALLLCGDAERETVARVRRMLQDNQLPIC